MNKYWQATRKYCSLKFALLFIFCKFKFKKSFFSFILGVGEVIVQVHQTDSVKEFFVHITVPDPQETFGRPQLPS